jgi:bifunctional non-homologous end joining protein LigD
MPLDAYRNKRDAARTPEPVPTASAEPARAAVGELPIFVIQEHHARSLHWDFRLERDGVLVSWAVPKGLPRDRGINHLAVHVEDHPLEYGTFEGHIPAGEYGGGDVTIFDHGHYLCDKWTDREVKVTLEGDRVRGRYALFQTKGDNWMIHKMDPTDGWEPLPDLVRPMLAVAGELPVGDGWAFEFKWDGVRAVLYVEGGRVRAMSRSDREIDTAYPELRGVGEALGTVQAVLDGEIVALDEKGRPSFEALQPRMHVADARRARQLAAQRPVVYMAFDVLHVEGRSTLSLPYRERRTLLDSLELAGPNFATPPSYTDPGEVVLAAARDTGLEGVVAKMRESRYRPGQRDPSWVKVKNVRTQDVVIGGWTPGKGNRVGAIGAVLMGIPSPAGLRYVGKVGSGLSATETDALAARFAPVTRPTSPFVGDLPRPEAADATFVEPRLVAEVRYTDTTRDGRLRHPVWLRLRPDVTPEEVLDES